MITVISAIIGFIASILPSLIKIWEKNTDYKHELELRRLELQAAQQGINLQTRLEEIRSIIEQNRAIYAHDESLSGSPTINNIRASVRPVITYTFFGLFIIIKIVALTSGVMDHLPIEGLVKLIWDEYTSSLFASIMCFWFGSRISEKTLVPIITKPPATLNTFYQKVNTP